MNKFPNYLPLFCLFLVLGSICSKQETEFLQDQVVIIDAGSTGSRIKIYTTNKTSSDYEFPKYVLSPETHKFGALSKLYLTPGRLVTKFCDVIVRQATKMVINPSRTKLYIFATAGMRGINETKVTSTVQIIRDYFNNPNKSRFQFSDINCRIISGEEEAVFAWISVNYINGAFQDPNIKTVGTLELGGASMQVAFESKKEILSHHFPVKIAGKWYRLYAHSYYSLGFTFLKDSIAEILGTDSNPCNLRVNNVHLKSEFKSCKELVNMSMVLKYDMCMLKPCPIRYVYQPSIDSNSPSFYPLGVFKAAMISLRKSLTKEDLKTLAQPLSETGDVTPSQLESLVKMYCQKDLYEVIERGISKKYATLDCIGGLYFVNILKALGFDEDNVIQGFLNKENVHKKTIKPDWTLGAIIYEQQKHSMCYKGSVRRVKNAASSNTIFSHIFIYLILPVVVSLSTSR